MNITALQNKLMPSTKLQSWRGGMYNYNKKNEWTSERFGTQPNVSLSGVEVTGSAVLKGTDLKRPLRNPHSITVFLLTDYSRAVPVISLINDRLTLNLLSLRDRLTWGIMGKSRFSALPHGLVFWYRHSTAETPIRSASSTEHWCPWPAVIS